MMNHCREECGACCIAPSLSTPMPLLPHGKEAGVRCPHLADDFRCSLYGHAERPAVCISFRPSREHCGSNRQDAMRILSDLEGRTSS